jgi:CubicO group peptidase (beta-lactamase class C family)
MRQAIRIGKLPLVFAAALTAVVVPGPVVGQNRAARAERVEELLQRYHQAGLFSGAALVAEAGTVTYTGAFGQASEAAGTPNRPETRFPVDSIAGTFASTLVLALAEEGAIELAHVPALDSARAIVEGATGRLYKVVLEERILAPLGLTQSGYGDRAGQPVASGHVRTLTGYGAVPPAGSPAPAGSVEIADPAPDSPVDVDPVAPFLTTVGDLFRWDQALHGSDLLGDPATAVRAAAVGFGWTVRDVLLDEHEAPVRVIESSGMQPGFSSHVRRYAEAGHTIVVLSNSSSDTGPIVREISRILFGLPPEMPKPSIAGRILKIVETAGVEAGLSRYRERRTNAPEAYTYGPGELTRLGRHFIANGDVETAMKVLESNVGLYPDSAIAYEGLGEASMAAGDTAAAIEAYRTSLELDPERNEARDRLVTLGVAIDPSLASGVEFPQEVLDGFVGSYELRPGEYVAIRREGTQLFARPGDQAEVELVATAPGRFVVRRQPLRFDFHLSPDGRATAVTVVEGERAVTALRVR